MATIITSDCINCGACEPECPNTAIYAGTVPWELNGASNPAIAQDIFYIVPSKCTECVGFYDHEACAAVCPVDCCIPDPNNPETEAVLLDRARALHPELTIANDAPSRFRKEGGAAAPAATNGAAAAPAQIFDELGNGLILRGTPVDVDKEDRVPRLTSQQAYDLLSSAMNEYRIALRNYPGRVVVHKSSNFTPQETDGFLRAARELRIDSIDFVTVLDSKLRLFREGNYPLTAAQWCRSTSDVICSIREDRSGITRPIQASTSLSR